MVPVLPVIKISISATIIAIIAQPIVLTVGMILIAIYALEHLRPAMECAMEGKLAMQEIIMDGQDALGV